MYDGDELSGSGTQVRPTEAPLHSRRRGLRLVAVAMVIGMTLVACSTKPLLPYTKDTPPLILVPAAQAGVNDKRGRFREIFCRILEVRGSALPDYEPCDQVLTLVGTEPPGTG